MIELVYRREDRLWSWARPAGPALAASAELVDDILIEVDIADPHVITGFTAPDGDVAHRVLAACLGPAAAPLIDGRVGGTIEVGEDTEVMRAAIGTWVLANDAAERTSVIEEPLLAAAWLVDAMLIGSQLVAKLELGDELVTRHRPRLDHAVWALSSTDRIVPQSDRVLRRLERAGEQLGQIDAEAAELVGRFAAFLGRSADSPTAVQSVPTVLAGTLQPDDMQVSSWRHDGNLIVHVDPRWEGWRSRRLVARAWRPDGTPLALADVRWPAAPSSGRAQLMVADAEPVRLEVTTDPQLPCATVVRRAWPHETTPMADDSYAQVPQAELARDAAEVAQAERRGLRVGPDWESIAERWRELGDDDRTWLALQHALALVDGTARLGSGGPEEREDRQHELDEQRFDLQMRSDELTGTWSQVRGESPAHPISPFVCDDIVDGTTIETAPKGATPRRRDE